MPETLIGRTFTFQVLFIDANGDPLPGVIDATIQVFSIDANGIKTVHALAAMAPVSPAEVGRFVHPFVINPNIFQVGQTLYVEFTGTDPSVGTLTIRTEEALDIVEAPSILTGLRGSFLKGG